MTAMIEDIGAYMGLHAPFIATLVWLIRTEWAVRWTRIVSLGVALAHSITIAAYLLDLGDDFANTSYWSMYLVLPATVLYLKLIRQPRGSRRPWLYIPLALVGLPALGLAGIIAALIISPIDFR